MNKGLASVDVVYEVVWMAGEPLSTKLESPLIRLRKPRGSIRITGPATDDSIWRASEPPSAQHQEPPIDYVSMYDPPGYTPSSPRITKSAAFDDIWRAGESLSTQHQRPSIGYESRDDLTRNLFSSPRDSVARELPSSWSQRSSIGYESRNNLPPNLFSSPRITEPAVNNNISIAREPSPAWSQNAMDLFRSESESSSSPPSSPRITSPAADRNIRMASEDPSLLAQEQSIAWESPYHSPPRTLSSPRITNSAVNNNTWAVNNDTWMAGEPSSFRSQRPLIDRVAAGPSYNMPPRSLGNVRNPGPGAYGTTLSRFQPQKQNDAPSSSKAQPISGGKIPCVAKLHVEKLGALSTCSYDKATDSFSNFSVNDAEWDHQKGYHDYGDIQMSTKKWSQGSWVSVKDDNGNEFLFVTVDKDHGLVRVWRPNLVAKRAVRVGRTEMTSEEFLRLGLHDDAKF